MVTKVIAAWIIFIAAPGSQGGGWWMMSIKRTELWLQRLGLQPDDSRLWLCLGNKSTLVKIWERLWSGLNITKHLFHLSV